jgi:4'-phosphopantetheinyl transferase
MADLPVITAVRWLLQSEADLPVEDEWLSPQEKACMAAMHVVKRRADWRLGRWTAKRAIASYWDLAHDPRVLSSIEVRPAPSGAPEVFWRGKPAGISISLSHRSGTSVCALAAVAVALGCDIESIEPHSDAFISDYFTPEEQALVFQVPDQQRWTVVSLIWSAKESALKALQTGLRLDTRTLRVVPEGPTNLHEATASVTRGGNGETLSFDLSNWQRMCVHCLNKTFQGWWRARGNNVLTLVCAPACAVPVALGEHQPSSFKSDQEISVP